MAKGEAYLLMDIEPGKEREVLETIKLSEHVESAYILFGEYDIITKIKCDDENQLGECVNKLRKLESVGEVEVLEVADVVV